MKHTVLITAFILVLLSISGCATTSTLQPGSSYSINVVDRTYDEIWKAVVKTASRSLKIVESNKQVGILKAEKDLGNAKWSEVVGVAVSPANNGAPVYTIKVLTLNRVAVELTGEDLTGDMIAGIKAELNK